MGPIVYSNIVIEGMLAFAALHYFLLWWRLRRERVLLIFSIFAAIVSVVIAVTVSLIAADSIGGAQRALNLRTTFGILACPLLLWLVSEIASVRPGRLGNGLRSCRTLSRRDLADRLRKERSGLKVLFMSGYTDDTLLGHGVYEAREAFLQKPFALQAFASKVRQILDQE